MEFYYIGCDQNEQYSYVDKVCEQDVFKWNKCPVCERVSLTPKSYTFSIKLTKASIFPDLLCLPIYPSMLIISQKMLCAFKNSEVSGYIPHELRVYGGNVDTNIVKYYSVEIIGKGQLDYHKMGIEHDGICQGCLKDNFKKIKNIYPIAYLNENSWDGSDIFGNRYCTKKILNIANEYKLKGIYFKPGVYSADSTNQTKIDLVKMFG